MERLYPLSVDDVERGPVVYLIHLHAPLKHARHYLGFSNNIKSRIHIHQKSLSDTCSFMRAVNLAGIQWDVTRLWIGEARGFERKLKKYANVSRYCPLCRQAALEKTRLWMQTHRKKEEVEVSNALSSFSQGLDETEKKVDV